VLNDGVRIMLIPTGGFGWITGGHNVAPAGSSECVISINARDDAGVDEVLERAFPSGATIVTGRARRRGDTPARSPIPTVTFG
jgi:predicted lactoylglutathione lyase